MPRFTISNLLVFVTAICVVLCAWQISVCRGLLEKKSERLAYLESRRRLTDINSDEKPDVTIDISLGIWHEQPDNFRATYQTTDKGFSRVENLKTEKVKTRKDPKKANSGSQQNDSSCAQLNSR